MDAASKLAFTEEVARSVFDHFNLRKEEWRDLGGFESFVFAHDADQRIFRVTHVGHRLPADIQAELEFLAYLQINGAAVCAPLPLNGSSLAVEHEGFVCCLFEMAGGRPIEQSDWQPELFRTWGESVGRFHRLAKDYSPNGPRRFDWRLDANLDIEARLPAEEHAIVTLANGYLSELDGLSTSIDVYGLIHSDAHAGNFFLDQGALKFFDFDDCCYQWFAFDVTTILFSAVLQPWVENTRDAQVKEARKFLPVFLDGYQQEASVSGLMLDQFPLFLKLRELSLYAVIHSHMDINQLDGWYPIKFMADRKPRLEADEPYLKMDFTAFT